MKADAVSRLSKALVPPATAMAKALSQAKWVPIQEAPGGTTTLKAADVPPTGFAPASIDVPIMREFNALAPGRGDLGEDLVMMPVELAIPTFWVKGQLLNVRNTGADFVVTVLGEEFDPRYPDRALRFDNSFTCQQFVSKWYAREAADPRAR